MHGQKIQYQYLLVLGVTSIFTIAITESTICFAGPQSPDNVSCLQKDNAQRGVDTMSKTNQPGGHTHLAKISIAINSWVKYRCQKFRLEKIEFKDKSFEKSVCLDSLQQSALLSRLFLKERNLPLDTLSTEELMPHITVLLQKPTTWCMHMKTSFVDSGASAS